MPATPKRRKLQPAAGARFPADVLADNVRDYRAVRRWSQDTLARAMRELGHKWSGVTVSDVERGERSVSTDELVHLAFMLNTTPTDLLDPAGIDGRGDTPVDINVATFAANGYRHWLDGTVRVVTEGPNAWHIIAVPGHDAEQKEADRAFRPRTVPPPPSDWSGTNDEWVAEWRARANEERQEQ